MQAIVTALDEPYRDQVENIWGELKAVFGLQSVSGSTRPHITFHVADSYDEARLNDALNGIATTVTPFELTTHGLGVFRGPQLVLYLHVTRDDALMAMHECVWDDAGPLATGTNAIYRAETWVPHITLAIGDVQESQVPAILQFLNRREYNWRIPATNLCFVPDVTTLARDWIRYDLAPAS